MDIPLQDWEFGPVQRKPVWVGQELSALGTTAQQVLALGSHCSCTSLSQPEVPEAPEHAQVTNATSVGDQPVATRSHWKQMGKGGRRHRNYSSF